MVSWYCQIKSYEEEYIDLKQQFNDFLTFQKGLKYFNNHNIQFLNFNWSENNISWSKEDQNVVCTSIEI